MKTPLFCLYFLFPVLLFAETTPPERLKTVVVTDSPVDSSLVTASPESSKQSLARIPGGTNFINADDYKKARATSFKDVLDFQPGVFVQSRTGGDESRVSIRGSGLQRTFHGRGLQILQDGLTLNTADGAFDMQALEPLAFRYTEIYRGANALRYGAATLGGAINFVSPTGYDAPLASARFEYGSFGYTRSQIASGQVVGPFDYYASLSHSAEDGFRDYSQLENRRANVNLGYKLSEDLETRFYFNYADSDSELPGSLTKAQALNNRRSAAAANVAREDKRDYETYRVANKTSYRWDNQQIDVGLSWTYKNLDHPIFNILTPFFATGPGTIDLESNDIVSDVRYVNTGEFLGRANTLTLGFSPSGSFATDARFENLAGANKRDRGRRFGDAEERVFNAVVYAENNHKLTEDLSLITGFQAIYADRENADFFLSDGNGSDDQDYYGFSPKLGVIYALTPKVDLFANVSRSYEPPSFGEAKTVLSSAGGPIFPNRLPVVASVNLEAQEATTIEFGTRGEWDRFAWDLAFYHSWIDNELLSLNGPTGAPLGTVNGTSTIHQGIELGLNTTVYEGLFDSGTPAQKPKGLGKDSKNFAAEIPARDPDKIVLRQVYNWSHFNFASDPVYGSNQLAGLPEHAYHAELVYEHPCGFSIGPNVEWIATRTPIDHANTFFTDGYAILGAKASYDTKRGLSGYVEIKNATDDKYVSTTGVIANAAGADSAQFNPGNGFATYVGLTYRY